MVKVKVYLNTDSAWVVIRGHCGSSLKERLVCTTVSALTQNLFFGLKDVLKIEVRGIILSGRTKINLTTIPAEKAREVVYAFESYAKSVEKLAKEFKCIKLIKLRGLFK